MKAPENWMAISGYEGRYCISDHGNVMSMNYRGTGLPGLMSPSMDTYGYPQVCLMKNGVQKSHKVHVLVLDAFVGPRPKGLHINHLSGIKSNNALSNLEYCTPSENRLHSYRIGTQVGMSGESHPLSKLNNASVTDIKSRVSKGERRAEVAAIHGVSIATVGMVVNGKRWGHLQ